MAEGFTYGDQYKTNKQLTKTQEELAQAAKDAQQSQQSPQSQEVTQSPETSNSIFEPEKKLAKNLATEGLITGGSVGLGKLLQQFPKFAMLGRGLANPTGLAVTTTGLSSYLFGKYLNDRFGISKKAANFFAPDNIDYMEKQKKDQALIDQGFNPNEPIYEDVLKTRSMSGSPYGGPMEIKVPEKTIVGYKTLDETLTPPKEMLANPEATANPEIFESSFERDGKLFGVKAGDRYKDAVEMTDEQIAQMNKDMQVANAPMISGTPAEGLRQFIDQQGNVMYGNDAAINTGYTVDGAGTTRDFQPIKQQVPFAKPMSQEEYIRRYSELQNAARESVFKDFDGADERARKALQEEFFSRQAPEAPETPAAPRLSPQENFERARDSEEGISPQQIAQAKDFAASMGRTFDPETGYSKEFSQDIYDNYQMNNAPAAPAGFNPNMDRGGFPKVNDRSGNIVTQAETTEFQDRNQDGIEDRSQPEVDFNTPTFTNYEGKTVPANDRNKAERKMYNGLVRKYQEEGMNRSEAKAAATSEMGELKRERNRQAIADRAAEIGLRKSEIDLIEAERDLLKPEEVEEPSAKELRQFVENVEQIMPIQYDPMTGTFSKVEDVSIFADKLHPLHPDSDLYQRLEELPNADYFLQAPPTVRREMNNQPEGGIIRADDGRVFQKKNGQIEHIDWMSKEKFAEIMAARTR